MTHNERVQIYERYMAAHGVPRSAASPVPWQWLWACGIDCPPPPFMSGWALGLFAGAGLAVIPLVLWVLSYVRHPLWHHLPARQLIGIVGVSFLVGAWLVPLKYRRLARRCGLARWATFHGKPQVPEGAR